MRQTGRRRGLQSILVEPYLQVKLGLMFILINSAFSVIIITVLGYYLYDVFSAVTTYFQLSKQETAFTITKLFVPLGVTIFLVLLFYGTTIYVAIRYTHRIYGPLVSIHRFLDELLDGKKPKPIMLRESDQLQELATKLNTLADTLTKSH